MQGSWFVEQMLFYLFLIRISCRFSCSGLHFILGDHFCWSLLWHCCIILKVHFIWESFHVFSSDLHRKWSARICTQGHGNVYECQHTYSPRLFELFIIKSTLDRRFWNGKRRFLHPVGWHWSSNLNKRRADRPGILRGIVVDDNLLNLYKIGSKSLLINSSLDIPSSSMMSTSSGNDNQVKNGSLKLDI